MFHVGVRRDSTDGERHQGSWQGAPLKQVYFLATGFWTCPDMGSFSFAINRLLEGCLLLGGHWGASGHCIVCSMKLWRARRPKMCHPSVKVFGWAILHDAQAGHSPTPYSLIDDALDRRPGNFKLGFLADQ